MNRERYLFLISWAKEKPIREKVICGMTKWIPVVLAAIYIFSLLFSFVFYPLALIRLFLRPCLCFIFVTILRNRIKAPRPYDVYDYVPLCGFHPGKNRSFPSRHTASAVILALEINVIWGGILGIFCIILSVMMGVCRVLCGNHFIKDVLAGAFIAFIFNCV